MTILPFPESPDPGSIFGIFDSILEVFANLLGDITVGEALEQIKDMPVQDVIKEFLK